MIRFQYLEYVAIIENSWILICQIQACIKGGSWCPDPNFFLQMRRWLTNNRGHGEARGGMESGHNNEWTFLLEVSLDTHLVRSISGLHQLHWNLTHDRYGPHYWSSLFNYTYGHCTQDRRSILHRGTFDSALTQILSE